MSKLQILTKGLLKENPTFVLLLGMCPTLATTTSAVNGLSMGLATLFVLVLSNMAISLVAPYVPDKVHIPAYIVVIATFVTLLQFIMQAYTPGIYASLGLFIPLIVVNCIILGRAEAFASKNGIADSALDGLGMGLGYTCALLVMSAIRQIIGTGVLNFANPITEAMVFEIKLIPQAYTVSMFTTPVGGFLTFACLAAALACYKNNKAKKAAEAEEMKIAKIAS